MPAIILRTNLRPQAGLTGHMVADHVNKSQHTQTRHKLADHVNNSQPNTHNNNNNNNNSTNSQ
eukprot:scaffold1936_cov201-Alexandrium_tamarense.AAC.8